MGRTAGIWPYVCLAPALAVFILLEIVPAFATSIFSLTDYTGLPHAPINWVGLENYTEPPDRSADVPAAGARGHGDLLAARSRSSRTAWRC